MTNRDKIYQTPLDSIAGFAFDENVARVFPDMIERSVPGYSTIIAMTGLLAARHAQAQSRCYDLGCSLGASTLAMVQEMAKNPDKNSIQIIGVDNSSAMIARCRENTGAHSNIGLRCENIEDTAIATASVIVMNFTLQFVAKQHRNALLKKIHDAMLPGGIMILSEKICFDDPFVNELNIELHHDFKRAHGYSDLEISQKRSALDKVLVPETLDAHRERLESAGFRHVAVWFQCFNFASMIAFHT